MPILKWRQTAIDDRISIFDYIYQENSVAAHELDSKFSEKTALLLTQPKMYPISVRAKSDAGEDIDAREIVVSKSYTIIYQFDEQNDVIYILRVVHTARKWPTTMSVNK